MANKVRGEIEVRLDGKTWAMRPAFQALAEIEGVTGLGIAAVMAAGIRAGHDDAPDYESVKQAIVGEGFNKFAVVASEFLAGALAGAVPTGRQTKKARAPGKTT